MAQHVLACGWVASVIADIYGKGVEGSINQCSRHAAADEMYEVCRRLVDWDRRATVTQLVDIVNAARAVIAQIEKEGNDG